MNRRGHLSTKIPNVKLRPAPSGSSSTRRRKEPSPMNAMDEEMLRRAWEGAEDEDTSSAALRRSSKPWKGVVMTFTGVDDKPRLSEMATKLGATIESALTVSVTHVVASGFGSAKYAYAVEHRLPVMTPEWIEDMHRRWIHAEEVDVRQHVQEYKLQAFAGLKIAMSGIEPIERRKQLVHYINSNGGLYSKDLDRTCTHLIANKPTTERNPSEKVKWAVKEVAAREALRRAGKKVEGEDMRIVYEEWVWDCVAFEGRWKEDWYDARKVRRAARATAEDVLNGTVPRVEVKRDDPQEEDNEPATLRKRKRENLDNLVGELISSAAIKVEPSTDALVPPANPDDLDSKPSLAHVATPDPAEAPLIAPRQSRREPELRKTSLLHATRTNSFAGPSKAAAHTLELDPSLPASVPSAPETQPAPGGEEFPLIFDGLRFSHLIEEKAAGLEQALIKHGGTLVSEQERLDGEDVDYIIVRLCSTARPVLLETGHRPLVVTECWIEGSCFEQRLLDPDSHLVFRPLTSPMPIPGAQKFLVHMSGFSSENAVYLRRLLRVIGGTLSLKLGKQTTHLVCAQPAGPKYAKAPEWGVSVVRDSWLLEMGRTGRLQPEEEHRHVEPTVAMDVDVDTTSALPPALSDTDIAHHSTSPASAPSLPPSRALKSTPTLIDNNPRSRSLEVSHTSSIAQDLVQPLSPPKAETERLLNQASSPRKGSPAESIESKLSRASSAPGHDALRKPKPKHEPAKAATVAGFELGDGTGANNANESGSGSGGKREMIEVLRQLAQKEDSTPGRSKLVRRSRPSSRLRTSMIHSPISPLEPDTSGDGVNPNNASGRSSPAAEADESGWQPGMGMGTEAEESLRVNYVDPQAEKEKRKLVEALRRGQAAAAAAAAPTTVEWESPKKRTRAG